MARRIVGGVEQGACLAAGVDGPVQAPATTATATPPAAGAIAAPTAVGSTPTQWPLAPALPAVRAPKSRGQPLRRREVRAIVSGGFATGRRAVDMPRITCYGVDQLRGRSQHVFGILVRIRWPHVGDFYKRALHTLIV